MVEKSFLPMLVMSVVYFSLAALMLNLNAAGFMTTLAWLPRHSYVILTFTILPWFTVWCALKTMPPVSLSLLALITLSVSGFGLVLALITADLGYKPGEDCYRVQELHGIILFLSLIAFSIANKSTKTAAILLRLCSIIYFYCGWVISVRAATARCGIECTPDGRCTGCMGTGWEVLGLNLFDLNTIVSSFMGFFVLMAVSKARKSDPLTIRTET